MYEASSGAEMPLYVSHSRSPAKNWIPFIADGRLYLVYQLEPLCLQACEKARRLLCAPAARAYRPGATLRRRTAANRRRRGNTSGARR